ncbi:MAG: hypothetical protein ABS939_09310 [Psychrobacillus sp.]
MRIMHEEEDKVWADVIGLDNPNVMLMKKNVYVPSIRTLMIPQQTFERLKEGKMQLIYFTPNQKSLGVLKAKPQLIKFKTVMLGYEMIFELEHIWLGMSLNDMVVKISLKNKLI